MQPGEANVDTDVSTVAYSLNGHLQTQSVTPPFTFTSVHDSWNKFPVGD